MFVEFSGKNCSLYSLTRQLIRKFHVSNDITNVQVTGNGNNAVIAITMKNGKTILYKGTGQVIRR